MKAKLICLLRRLYDNSYIIGMTIALVFFLGVLLFACATPIEPVDPRIDPPKVIAEPVIAPAVGTINISNSTAAVYLVTVYDVYNGFLMNVVWKEYVMPNKTKEPFSLKAGRYKVCFKSSGLWGRMKCVEKVVEAGKENKWEIKRKK